MRQSVFAESLKHNKIGVLALLLGMASNRMLTHGSGVERLARLVTIDMGLSHAESCDVIVNAVLSVRPDANGIEMRNMNIKQLKSLVLGA